ncbi:MAG: alpha-galactosidase, partial [Saprospiraceae bacterium]
MLQKILAKQKTTLGYPIEIMGDTGTFKASLEEISNEDDIQIFRLRLTSDEPAQLNPLSLKWNLPAHDIKGVWTTNALHEKRLRADWEAISVESSVSVEAPVLCLFSHEDYNVQTFACSDVINTLQLEAPVREEDNLIYCHIHFFAEKMP